MQGASYRRSVRSGVEILCAEWSIFPAIVAIAPQHRRFAAIAGASHGGRAPAPPIHRFNAVRSKA
ncbi:hypothetical protein C8246_23260 [Paracidovorax avenae]|nr:hypothetical protein C8247_13520 [Paracidovorax avenae]AVS94175.1 hypothetical protein C8246_23260 [Paracidovorax avenae]AVS99654.1 hypothetical protein C8236_13060 [Paracidovorax avenae]